jgi:pimeloyl-ACP methyl ester carboxylesterase
MSTDIATTLPPRRGRIRRIVAVSVGTGAAAALVLVLVVVAGAPEHVITGSALLGFAVGWGVLAVSSTRLTDQPQRWAFVPAAALGATGLGLLVLAPDDGALTTAGWVWPPLLLALAGWTWLRTRRSLAARSGRWMLYPVAALMVGAAVGGTVESVALAADRQEHVMPGRSYDVGGHRLHLHCTGSGGPTVVLQSGLGGVSPLWDRIAPAVARTTRVCAYDRAGQGWSDDLARPQDGLEVTADLRGLLDRAGEEGPYVLVGHSTGGTFAMTHAARHPGEVAGMVLMDPSDPYRSSTASAEAGAPAGIAVLPSLSRLGLGRLVPASAWSSLAEPAAGQVQAFMAGARGWRGMRDEYVALPALFAQARALTTLGDTPLVVLTATASPHRPGWAETHERMAALSSDSSHRYVDTTHVGLQGEAAGAAASVDAIGDVVRAARTGAPLPRH